MFCQTAAYFPIKTITRAPILIIVSRFCCIHFLFATLNVFAKLFFHNNDYFYRI